MINQRRIIIKDKGVKDMLRATIKALQNISWTLFCAIKACPRDKYEGR
jgi:hypothetical protein